MTALLPEKMAVGVFSSRRNLELALEELKDIQFPMEKVSLVVQDAKPEDEIAIAPTEDSIVHRADRAVVKGAFAGSALGSIAGLLVGLGVLAIPGIGPIVLLGVEAAAIASALSGGAVGAAAGALIRSGIPEEQAKAYSDRLLQGQYLMFVNGTEADILAAKVILNLYDIQEWRVYDAPATTSLAQS